jgi:hypothetical protein
MILEEIIRDLLKTTLKEVRKDENMTRLQTELVDPIIQYAFAQLYPYIVVTALGFFLIFILALLSFVFILRISHS